jgi:shikimate dehydrogenase
MSDTSSPHSPLNLGLIGYPLSHSLSPAIHTAALRASGLAGSYSLFPVRPHDGQALINLLGRVRSGELNGLNVTLPHKQNVVPLLDAMTPAARSIGAVNTIFMQQDQLMGDNTDAPGFLADLLKFAGSILSSSHPQRPALVLGAGGSALAVVYALINAGWDISIFARREAQARRLAIVLGQDKIKVINFADLEQQPFDLLVNTTPVGMAPAVDSSPWEYAFPSGAVVYDLVYNPRETRLVHEASAAGLPATTGLGMLVEQASLAFEIWTGWQPPRETLFEAAAAAYQSMTTV